MRIIKRKPIDSNSIELLKGTSAEQDALRQLRKPLLAAFDIWEKAVTRGREVDDPEIMEWFSEIKSLNPEAIKNIPERIRYYL